MKALEYLRILFHEMKLCISIQMMLSIHAFSSWEQLSERSKYVILELWKFYYNNDNAVKYYSIFYSINLIVSY
jgi:hypothetical protein